MRTALYLCVSTSHQKPDLQADGLRRYATRAGLDIIAEYVDVAVSGRKEGRPSSRRWTSRSGRLRCLPGSASLSASASPSSLA